MRDELGELRALASGLRERIEKLEAGGPDAKPPSSRKDKDKGKGKGKGDKPKKNKR